MTHDRPLDLINPPCATFSLAQGIIDDLRRDPAYAHGKNSRALVRSSDRELSIVISVLQKDAELKPHQAPSPATVIVLEGELLFTTYGEETKETLLGQHDLAVFTPEIQHSVRATKETVMLIVMGGR